MGMFDQLKESVMTLGILAILVAAMVIAVGAFQDNEISTITDTNVTEQITLDNGTAVSLANKYVTAVALVVNSTDATMVVGSGNYTVTNVNSKRELGALTHIGEARWDGQAVNVTYSYKNLGSKHSYNVTEDGLTGQSNLTSYLGTIGTLLGVAALILVVMLGFGLLIR